MKANNLIGKSFNHRYLGKTIKFTVTRDYGSALRLIINDSIQAIWLPKICFYIDDKGIRVKSIDWKLKRKEFKHKLNLASDSMPHHQPWLKNVNILEERG